jgi:hypothetical protein
MSQRRFTFLTAEEIVRHNPADSHCVLPRRHRGVGDASRTPESPYLTAIRAAPEGSDPVPTAGPALGTLDRPGDGRSRMREADRVRGGCSGTLSRSPEPRSSAAKPLCRFAERRITGLWRSPPRGSLGAVVGLISASLSRVYHPAFSRSRGPLMWPFRAHNQELGQSSWRDPGPAGSTVSGRFLDVRPCARIQGRDWRAKRKRHGRGEPRRAAA